MGREHRVSSRSASKKGIHAPHQGLPATAIWQGKGEGCVPGETVRCRAKRDLSTPVCISLLSARLALSHAPLSSHMYILVRSSDIVPYITLLNITLLHYFQVFSTITYVYSHVIYTSTLFVMLAHRFPSLLAFSLWKRRPKCQQLWGLRCWKYRTMCD